MSTNTLLGLRLFFFYSLLYLGFMFLCTFQPQVLEWCPVAGINLAIWYGFGLIVSAVVMAFVYGWMCRSEEVAHEPSPRRSA